MQCVEAMESLAFKNHGSRFDLVIQLYDKWRLFKDRLHVSLFLRMRILFRLKNQHFRRDQFNPADFEVRKYPKNRFRLKRNSQLRAVVQRAIQTACIKIDSHGPSGLLRRLQAADPEISSVRYMVQPEN